MRVDGGFYLVIRTCCWKEHWHKMEFNEINYNAIFMECSLFFSSAKQMKASMSLLGGR